MTVVSYGGGTFCVAPCLPRLLLTLSVRSVHVYLLASNALARSLAGCHIYLPTYPPNILAPLLLLQESSQPCGVSVYPKVINGFLKRDLFPAQLPAVLSKSK